MIAALNEIVDLWRIRIAADILHLALVVLPRIDATVEGKRLIVRACTTIAANLEEDE